ncbi:hypothetical protein C6497_14775 [Candidatus Poribacteria bacterium]|nr:MAG: hypothetical protein C6497_14775 [Candidatus Poribacteria bacterium]
MLPRRILFAAFAISASASFLLCGYEFIRAVSTSLYVTYYTAENLPRVWIAVFPGVLLFIYFYGRLLSAFGATRALAITSLFSSGLIFLCFLALKMGFHFAAAIIYVFREAYIVIIIEQIWSFVNSTLTSKQAKTINGPFCAIASVGSVVGGVLVGMFAVSVGSINLLLGAVISLIPTAFFAVIAYSLAGEPKPTELEAGGKLGHLGVKTLFRSKYLLMVAILVISTQVISSVLDLRFNGFVEAEITETDSMTSYYGIFYARLAAISAILQLIVVPFALRLVSIRVIHVLIPIIHLLNGLILSISPSLKTGARAFLTFKALDYSLFRAGKELFYMPLSYDERYRCKQIIDSFGYRSAKSGSASILELVRLIVVRIPGIALSITAMAISCVWAVLVSSISSQYIKLEKTVKTVDNSDTNM